jgi:xylulokinase
VSGEPLLLGLDVGTASSKAVLASPDGAVVASAERAHGLSLPRPGWAEHDAEAVWWDDVVVLCRELLDDPAVATRVAGVCVSGIGPCLLPADADLRPLRPAILYGIDSRATAEIAEVDALLGEEAIVARGGSALSSQAVGPKMVWLRRHEPDVWARTKGWYMASSYAVARLTGEYVLDHHSASQCDPLYDLAAGDWARDWAEAIAPGVPLPRLAWPGEAVGAVHAAGARETGLPEGTPVAAGTIDAWAEAFSVGVRRAGDLMIMYGSTMFLVQVASEPVSHPALWLTAGVEPATRSFAAGMATSGSLTNWLAELAGGVDFATLASEAAAVPAGARGLVVLPYFAGERSPIHDPHARGVIAGLTLSHGRAELMRAVYEGVAYGVRHNLGAFAEAGGAPARAVAVGGGTRAPLWAQIVSDVTGLAQQVPAVRIGAAYGDALLAAIAAGVVAPETDWTTPESVVSPDPARRGRYDELYARYLELYPATAGIVHHLAAVDQEDADG